MYLLLFIVFFVTNCLCYIRDDCECGLINTDTRRISNGVEVESLKYQWMVALFNAHDKPHCGGALISDIHVLTAGHCVSFDKKHPNYWREQYGKIRAHDIINKGESMNFNKIYVHPNYKVGDQFDDYDMTILKYREQIQLFWHLRTICIPEFQKDYAGKIGIITGWGTVNENIQKMEHKLREGSIQILDASQCPSASNLYQLFNFQSMTCGLDNSGSDTCQGDSGGPLIVERSVNVYEVVGVASFGAACGGKYAGVYADITKSLPWIWSIINTTGICPPPSIK